MENKTGKYFKYAIGEIVLVVIGILIALSINNWNQEQKLKQTQISILKGIYSDLKKDTIDINDNIRQLKINTKSDSLLINNLLFIKTNSPEIQSIAFNNIRINRSLALHNTFYNVAINKGFDIITNVALRERIGRLYEFEYKYLEYNENINPLYQFGILSNDKLGKYISIDPAKKGISISPSDYQDLISNQKLHLQLILIFQRRKSQLKEGYLPVIKNVNELMVLISKEIEALEK